MRLLSALCSLAALLPAAVSAGPITSTFFIYTYTALLYLQPLDPALQKSFNDAICIASAQNYGCPIASAVITINTKKDTLSYDVNFVSTTNNNQAAHLPLTLSLFTEIDPNTNAQAPAWTSNPEAPPAGPPGGAIEVGPVHVPYSANIQLPFNSLYIITHLGDANNQGDAIWEEQSAIPINPTDPSQTTVSGPIVFVSQLALSEVSGDPVFAGFQGQNFQFHGLPDEHFNLISTPNMQLNSHFIYISSGTCNYNDTECYTHPGTYMDVLGFQIGATQIKMQAGSHEAGMRVWMMDTEITPSMYPHGVLFSINNSSDTASVSFQNGHVAVSTPEMDFEITNSDYFFNFAAALKSRSMLTVGAAKHTVSDRSICAAKDSNVIEQAVAKKYHSVSSKLHGLIGQTWRNVKVCGKDWMGTVEDYMVSSLFGNENKFNYFSQ